jgi:general L-amino acid transport system substrate-binding protein
MTFSIDGSSAVTGRIRRNSRTLAMVVCRLLFTLVFGLFVLWDKPAKALSLQDIERSGQLKCSVASGGFYGFSELDNRGNWRGFDVELCNALAIAIFGTKSQLTLYPVTWQQRFEALANGSVDVVPSTTQTLTRETDLHLLFSLPYFHGSVQFLAKASSHVKSLRDLSNPTVCVTSGTSTGRAASDYLAGLGREFKIIAYETTEQAKRAYVSGRCDAFGGFGPTLAAIRAKDIERPEEHQLLDDRLADEPTALAFARESRDLATLASYVVSALIEAEELEINKANVEQLKESGKLNSRQAVLLGVMPMIGKRFGLREDWAYDVLRAVGNYAEIYDRNLGKDSPYRLPRGVNRLWQDQGMLYSLPLM